MASTSKRLRRHEAVCCNPPAAHATLQHPVPDADVCSCCHVCTVGPGSPPPTSAPGLYGLTLRHVCYGTGLTPRRSQVPDVDVILVPVGGGGLIAGVSLAMKTLHPEVHAPLLGPSAPLFALSARRVASSASAGDS